MRAHSHALPLNTENDPDALTRYMDLGRVWLKWLDLEPSIDAVIKANDANSQALSRMLKGHPDRATVLNNLGRGMFGRYELENDEFYLRRSIIALDEAMALTPNDDINYIDYLTNLCPALYRQAERTGLMEDL